MKKLILVSSMILLSLCSVCLAQEEYAEIEGQESSKIGGSITIKNDWISRPNSDVPSLSTYFKWKFLGGGFDLKYCSRGSVTKFQPYITLNKGPWYALVGYSVDDSHAQYFQTGVWYVNSFGKLSVVLDVRNWWSLNSWKTQSYFDPFVQLLYPIPKPFNIDDKLYFGLEGEINHWWSGQAHNWYQVGPVVRCKITKNLAVFLRLSHEWDVKEDSTENAFRIRTGVVFSF